MSALECASAPEHQVRSRRIPLWGKAILGLAVLALAGAILFPNSHTKMVLVEQCTSCFAIRRTADQGLWVYGKHVLGGGTSVSEDLSVAMDLGPVLKPGHEHRWGFSAMQYYFAGLNNGVSCGHAGFNPVALAMRNDSELRARIEERVGAGEFSQGEVAGILALPQRPTVQDTADQTRLHLYRRGQDLLRSVGCFADSRWPGEREKEHPRECACQRHR